MPKKKTVEDVMILIKGNPSITIDELQKEIDKSDRTVKQCLQILKERGRIKRVDSPTFGGRWEVMDSQK